MADRPPSRNRPSPRIPAVTPATTASRLGSAIRLGGLLAFAAFGLHQFRYLAAHGSESGEQLAAQGHGYLAGALPYLAALLVAALAATVLRARSWRGDAVHASFAQRALAYAVAILLVYAFQELLEGTLAVGHPAGLDALVADAGWLALPLAALLGTGAALLVVALEGLESMLAAHPAPRGLPQAPRGRGRPSVRRPLSPRPSPMAFGLARRPPPAIAST